MGLIYSPLGEGWRYQLIKLWFFKLNRTNKQTTITTLQQTFFSLPEECTKHLITSELQRQE